MKLSKLSMELYKGAILKSKKDGTYYTVTDIFIEQGLADSLVGIGPKITSFYIKNNDTGLHKFCSINQLVNFYQFPSA